MSAKILSSLTDENRNLRKQIGCIFQIFDRRHISSSRRLSSQDQNRIDLLEPKEKPRRSVASMPRASNSSLRHSETQYERIATKEKEKQQTKILRDVVKDSMYREARLARNEEKRGNVVVKQHVDSPRPLRRKPAGNERSKDDQEMMSLRRFSCDGRETKNEPRTRLKELPRLSLDSRAGSINLLSSAESRLDFLDRFRVEYESRRTEPGNHHRRSSSVVAKLMGLEAFPSADENRPRNSISSPKELLVSPRLRHADSLQDSPKMAPQSEKAFANGGSPHLSSSVYGEIEKRITELEFKKSGKDLRALKQILEAMQKTRERIENQIEQSAAASSRRRKGSEDLGYDLNSNSPTWQKRKIKGPNSPKSIDRSRFTSSASIDALNVQSRLQNSSTRSNNETTTPTRRKARALEPRGNHLSSVNKKGFMRRDMEQDRTIKAPRGSKDKSCTISAKSLIISSSAFYGDESTRPSTPPAETVKVRKNLSKKVIERNSQDKRHKTKAKTPQLIDDTQLNEVSISEVTTCSSYQGDALAQNLESNYTIASPVEADSGVKKQKYLKTRIEQIPQFQLEEASIEQPSPVSVLDAAFYSEDPPSPVRKITLAFQENEDPISDESEYRGSVMAAHKIRFSNIDQRVTSSNQDAPSAFGIHSITLSVNSNVSSHLISPDMFRALEIEAAKKMKPNQKDERKIIPDLVNEILFRKNTSGGLYTAAAVSPRNLMKEVSQEINSMNTIQSSNLDDDGMLKLMASDMKHESEDWTRYKSEVPVLALDIERLIFKDLINEMLTNAAS